MNCHENHDGSNNGNKQGNNHKGHLSHMLMMVLCCGAPVLILLLLPLLTKLGGSGIAKLLAGVAPFICPLMMVFMIPMMLKGGKGRASKDDCHTNKQVQLEGRTSENNN